jgi:hypothetical protein
MANSIPAGQIKSELDSVIVEADTLEPLLAERLRWFSRWIKEKTPGLLTKKPLVMDFLIELMQDAKLWLKIKALNLEERREFFLLAELAPTEQYWYGTLFPAWFSKSDPKMTTWAKKLMAGEFPRTDQPLLEKLIHEINDQRGTSFDSYILDLAMATDLLISGTQKQSIALQLTTNSPRFLAQKQSEWEKTLIYWSILRGVLLSYNPRHPIDKVVSSLLPLSDSLADGCYSIKTSTQ